MKAAHTPRLSSGAIVVRAGTGGWLFLMLRAYRNWDFPKGLVEPGEDPLAAARREVAEETGIEDLRFTWGESYFETAPYRYGRMRKIARYYLAEALAEEVILPVRPELGRPEHHEYRWFGCDEALDHASARVRPAIAWAAGFIGIGTMRQRGRESLTSA